MADDYARQGQTFRTREVGGKQLPIMLVGAHVRVSDDYQKITLNTGSVFTLTVPGGATHADIYFEGTVGTDYGRYLHGPDDPTSTDGIRIKDHELITSSDPATFGIVRGQATSCIVHVEYWHYA